MAPADTSQTRSERSPRGAGTPEYPYLDLPREDILRMIAPDGRVIGSIGCGTGATESRLVRQGREVHGVDVAPAAITVARDRLTSARLVAPDDELPFEPDSLDGLILADVIEHMPRAWDRLAEFTRMVKPGGWVVISVPNMRYVEPLATFVIGGDWPEHPLGIFDQTHLQVMTHRRLLRWCARAGLRLDRWYDHYDYRFVRRNLYRLANILTFKLFRSFLTFEVQGRFRRI